MTAPFISPGSAAHLIQLTRASLPSRLFLFVVVVLVKKSLKKKFWVILSACHLAVLHNRGKYSPCPNSLSEIAKPSHNLQTGVEEYLISEAQNLLRLGI